MPWQSFSISHCPRNVRERSWALLMQIYINHHVYVIFLVFWHFFTSSILKLSVYATFPPKILAWNCKPRHPNVLTSTNPNESLWNSRIYILKLHKKCILYQSQIPNQAEKVFLIEILAVERVFSWPRAKNPYAKNRAIKSLIDNLEFAICDYSRVPNRRRFRIKV